MNQTLHIFDTERVNIINLMVFLIEMLIKLWLIEQEFQADDNCSFSLQKKSY